MKILVFCQNLKFLKKILIKLKFHQILTFFPKFQIFAEIQNFHRNSKFLMKLKTLENLKFWWIFGEIWNFHRKSKCFSVYQFLKVRNVHVRLRLFYECSPGSHTPIVDHPATGSATGLLLQGLAIPNVHWNSNLRPSCKF